MGLTAIGPKILGRATDLIFSGLIGGKLAPGITKAQAVEQLRQQGQDKVAAMVSSMDVVPGQGVDFTAVRNVLLVVLAVYVAASALSWLQGYLLNDVVQGTVLRMRAEVEDKVNRLPLSYFDRQPRGELLSRVTNDIDNVSQTLQQTMSQLMTSLLTVVAVLGFMVWISPLLALIALISVPLSLIVTKQVMRRSQGMFVDQWRRTGKLNAHIEETFSGHALVKVFGRQREVEEVFARENEELYQAELRRPVRQRPDHARDDVHREPQLRRHRGDRRPARGERHDVAGRRPGLHPVLPPVHPAADPGRLDGQPAAVGGRVGRARLRAARRRGAVRSRPRKPPSLRTCVAARSASSGCPSPTTPSGR